MPIASNFLIKSVVSLRYDLMSIVVSDVRKLSTSFQIFSVGQPFAYTMGLPGESIVPLCIFGRRYSFAVLHSLSVW